MKDLDLLNKIKFTFGIGTIITDNSNTACYSVWAVKDLQKIIDHFEKYPLITYKSSDFILFKKCLEIIQKKEHLTEIGLLNILSLKNSLNLGLSEHLKSAFPNILKIKRSTHTFTGIPDPFWVAGFISGDGSFNVVIIPKNSTTLRIGGIVSLNFQVCLNIRDEEVIKGLFYYFNSLLTAKDEDSSK